MVSCWLAGDLNEILSVNYGYFVDVIVVVLGIEEQHLRTLVASFVDIVDLEVGGSFDLGIDSMAGLDG